jgi:branched-chain amino acid transport system permease protein
MVFLQLFLNGLQLGAIYALTAVGFSLIFGSTKIFHVAHGSAFAIGGYIYWWLASKLNVPWPLAALAAVVAASVFGLFMERSSIGRSSAMRLRSSRCSSQRSACRSSSRT